MRGGFKCDEGFKCVKPYKNSPTGTCWNIRGSVHVASETGCTDSGGDWNPVDWDNEEIHPGNWSRMNTYSENETARVKKSKEN